MKRINFRTFIWTLLIGASLASYIYLNSKSTSYEQVYSQGYNKIQVEDEDVQGESTGFLAEIALVKKILNITKIVLPKQ